MKEQEIALNELISYRDKLDKIEYEDIKTLIKESLKQIPITTAKLQLGEYIDRVRINNSSKLFNSQKEISYITDENIIEKYLTEYGRANKPHEPLFYGALRSSKIQQNRLTAYLETSKLLRDNESINLEGELFTVSRWNVNSELEVAEMVFSDEALKNNHDTYLSFKYHMEKIKDCEYREISLRQLQLFSNEFSRKIKTHNDYKISTAYADLILNESELKGITYPSVQSNYQGQNIVLKPKIVDKYIELTNVSTHRLHKNRTKSTMCNYLHTTNFGENNDNFIWHYNQEEESQKLKDCIKEIE